MVEKMLKNTAVQYPTHAWQLFMYLKYDLKILIVTKS